MCSIPEWGDRDTLHPKSPRPFPSPTSQHSLYSPLFHYGEGREGREGFAIREENVKSHTHIANLYTSRSSLPKIYHYTNAPLSTRVLERGHGEGVPRPSPIWGTPRITCKRESQRAPGNHHTHFPSYLLHHMPPFVLHTYPQSTALSAPRWRQSTSLHPHCIPFHPLC